jgi:dipeptidyl aminopeptidase/acylaminoacyl peptidase
MIRHGDGVMLLAIYPDLMAYRSKIPLFAAFLITLVACGGTSNVALAEQDAVAFRASGESSVSVMAQNGDLLDISPGTSGEFSWPDRDRVISQLCGSVAETGVPIVLVSPDGVVIGPPGADWMPAMSPDGEFAAVACFIDGDTMGVGGITVVVDEGEGSEVRDDWSRSGHAPGSDQVELRIMKIDGSSVSIVSHNEAADWLPRWSPDGLHILYETNRDGDSEIYWVDADGRGTRNMTAEASANDLWPAWSRDGLFVAYTSDRTGGDEIFTAQRHGGGITPTGHHGYPIPWGE